MLVCLLYAHLIRSDLMHALCPAEPLLHAVHVRQGPGVGRPGVHTAAAYRLRSALTHEHSRRHPLNTLHIAELSRVASER